MSMLAELPSDKTVALVILAVWLVCFVGIVTFLVLPPKHVRQALWARTVNWIKARASRLQ